MVESAGLFLGHRPKPMRGHAPGNRISLAEATRLLTGPGQSGSRLMCFGGSRAARLRGEQDRHEHRSEGGDDRGRDEGEVEAIHERGVSAECCGAADASGDSERVARLTDECRGEAWEMAVTAVRL